MMYSPPKKKGPRTNKPKFAGKMRLRTGDLVRVIAGRDKDREGTIIRIIPTQGMVVIEGLNIVTKHQKARQQASVSGIGGGSVTGGRVEMAAPISQSKVQLVDKGSKDVVTSKGSKAAVTRIGIKTDVDGNRVRYAKKSGSVIENG